MRDASQRQLRLELAAFARRLEEAGPDAVSFFYFAGHGAADRTDRGENYLLPVDAPITSASELPIMGVGLSDVIKTIERAPAKARFVVIDACRNVAFTRGTRSAQRGFVEERRHDGIIVAFSTRPGDVAADANFYSASLAEALAMPGLDATAVFKEVQLKVASLTKNQQVPWTEDGLLLRFQFLEGAPSAGPSVPPSVQDVVLWELIKDTSDLKVVEAFLQRYPQSSLCRRADSARGADEGGAGRCGSTGPAANDPRLPP